MKDAWAGRRTGMDCGTCVFFVKKGDYVDSQKGFIGRCRANAPTIKGFPVVWEIDWCGDHRLDGNKFQYRRPSEAAPAMG
jgi:hypothetical protein